jgi:hypothetical protein
MITDTEMAIATQLSSVDPAPGYKQPKQLAPHLDTSVLAAVIAGAFVSLVMWAVNNSKKAKPTSFIGDDFYLTTARWGDDISQHQSANELIKLRAKCLGRVTSA